MDYQKELDRLKESSDYWKPEVGQYKVKALSELQEAEPFVRENDGKQEVTPQAKIDIEINGKKMHWTFGIGKTPASTYGQLVEYAVKHGNVLLGSEFTVVVKSDGKKKDYTIV